MDVAAIITLLTALISAVGLWNLVLVAVIILIVFNAPTIVSQILRTRERWLDKKTRNMTAEGVKNLLTIILDRLEKLQNTADSNNDKIETNRIKIDEQHEITKIHLEEQHEESVAMGSVLSKILNTIASMDLAMRHVLAGKDAEALVSVKLGVVENLKNNILKQITLTIESNPGRRNGQLKSDLRNDLDNIWVDFKNDFKDFKMPVDIKELLTSFDADLWSENGMFTQVMDLATSELTTDRRNEAISKLIDLEIRKIQAKIGTYLKQLDKDWSGQYGIYNWKSGE